MFNKKSTSTPTSPVSNPAPPAATITPPAAATPTPSIAPTDQSASVFTPVQTPTAETPTQAVPPAPANSSHKLLFIVSGIIVFLALAIGAYVMATGGLPNTQPGESLLPAPTQEPSPTPATEDEMVACTMDAKICPDGSSVGRVAPNCEFAACPGEEGQTSTTEEFSNDLYSFNYPSGWVPSEGEGSVILYPSEESMDGPGYVLSVSQAASDTLAQASFTDPVGTRKEIGQQIFSTKLKDFTVSGLPAVMLKTEILPGSATDSAPGNTVYVKDSDTIYEIILHKVDPIATEANFDIVVNSFELK